MDGDDRRFHAPEDRRSMTSNTLRLVSDSVRVIKVTIGPQTDVIEHLLEVDSLKSSILDFFNSESEETKCLVAKAHLMNSLKNTGDMIMKGMSAKGVFDLELFFEQLFAMSFPAPESALDIGFRKISQSYPTPTTIVEYSRRFVVFCEKLKLSLKSNTLKFIEGITNSEVRSSLMRYPYQTMEFPDLVSYAVGLQNTLSVAKKQEKAFLGISEGDETDIIGKIFDKPLKDYTDVLTKQNIKGKFCWNCFKGSHLSIDCRTKSCRFCFETNARCGHLSLLCPKRPRDLKKYVEERADKRYTQAMAGEEAEEENENIPFGLISLDE